ncbi:MAG: valine--tRNA ligase, partial [Bryobacteraceae bacterium]
RIAHQESVHDFSKLQQIVTAARELRADNKLDPKAVFPATLTASNLDGDDLAAIASLAKLDFKQTPDEATSSLLSRSAPGFDLRIYVSGQAKNGSSTPEARARIMKEIARLEHVIASSKRQLGDPVFLGRAPENVVSGLRAKLADYEAQRQKNKDLLEGAE